MGCHRHAGPLAVLLAAVLVAAALASCDSGSPKKARAPFTVTSVKAGFVTPADLGDGAVEFADIGHGAHIVYTPPDSIPTCPYVQRADDVAKPVAPALELPGGNSTGRIIVAPRDASKTPLPVVTEGALVFKTETLAVTAMRQVLTESAKCPASFTILGGPPVIVGDYKVTSRPFELAGWRGFAQHLAHTLPPGVDAETYDDLVTVVVHKANAILYVGLSQTKRVGERADSEQRVRSALDRTLHRIG